MWALILIGAYAIGTAIEGEIRDLQRRLALLEYQSEQAALNHETQATEIVALEDELTTVYSDLDTLAADLATDLADQEAMLTVLEDQLVAAIGRSAVISGNVESLTNVAVALQSDIISNTTSIDALGGTADGLQSDLNAITADVSALEGSVTGLDDSLTTLDGVVANLTDSDAALAQFSADIDAVPSLGAVIARSIEIGWG